MGCGGKLGSGVAAVGAPVWLQIRIGSDCNIREEAGFWCAGVGFPKVKIWGANVFCFAVSSLRG